MTLKFAVIGHPIDHSKSPQLHEAGFREFEIDASFEKIDITPENLEAFLKEEAKHYTGIAVTVPHKETVMKYIDFYTEAAQSIGAVNTLYWKDGKLCGTNTDGLGALRALKTQTELEGKNVFVLGAGGAAKAVVYGLKAAGAEVIIYNRTFSKAEALAEQFDAVVLESLQLAIPHDIDIVINTTTVGMNEYKSLLPEDFWMPQHIGFDIVYKPLYTKFLQDCESVDGTCITGDKMLTYQALEQFRLWHGMMLEPEIMESAFFDE